MTNVNMGNFFRRLLGKFRKTEQPQSLLSQYNLYFKKHYGIAVWSYENEKDVFVMKPNGDVVRLVNPSSFVELFEAIERIGKAI